MVMKTRINRPGRYQVDLRAARKLRDEVFGHMRGTRGKKYWAWLLALSVVRILLPERSAREIFLTVYAAMREGDDPVDGDKPLPSQYGSAVEYVDALIAFVWEPQKPSSCAEYLLAYALSLMSGSGFDIREEVVLVLESLRFDATRRNPFAPRIFLQDELRNIGHRRDELGVISAMLKLTREWEKGIRPKDLAELGEVVQFRYNLRDVHKDWRAGYCNIPLEALRAPELTILRKERGLPDEIVSRWSKQEASRGKTLLKAYKKRRRKLPFSWRTRVTLFIAFQWRVDLLFWKILRQQT